MRITQDITTHREAPCAVALGFFDGVHIGHQAVIRRMVEEAATLGLRPCVFTFSTAGGIPAGKGELTLLQTDLQKEKLMERMGVEEIITPPFTAFRKLSPEQYVEELLDRALHARLLVCGENYHFGRAAAAGVGELEQLAGARGIRLVTVPPVLLEGQLVSSTRIRQAVREGEMPLAKRLLGAPFSIVGEVLHGQRLGRTLGSPTINLGISTDFTVPRYGVYISRVTTPLGVYGGVTNIGIKPTVGGTQANCETYLLDFFGDLYGKAVTVELECWLRGEQHFATVEELAAQIQRDIAEAKGMIGRG